MDRIGEREGGDDELLRPPVVQPPREGSDVVTIGRATASLVLAWVALISVLVAAGSSIAGLLRANLTLQGGAACNPVSTVLAMHAVGPRLALAGVCVLAVRAGSPAALIALGAVAALLQAFDPAAGAVHGDTTMTILLALLAVAQGYAIVLLDLARVPRGTAGT